MDAATIKTTRRARHRYASTAKATATDRRARGRRLPAPTLDISRTPLRSQFAVSWRITAWPTEGLTYRATQSHATGHLQGVDSLLLLQLPDVLRTSTAEIAWRTSRRYSSIRAGSSATRPEA